jgi:hypothetical protein
MHTTLLILGLLACPLGMAAFGGIAWLGARAFGDCAPRLVKLSQRAGCLRNSRSQPSTDAREAATEARTYA